MAKDEQDKAVAIDDGVWHDIEDALNDWVKYYLDTDRTLDQLQNDMKARWEHYRRSSDTEYRSGL